MRAAKNRKMPKSPKLPRLVSQPQVGQEPVSRRGKVVAPINGPRPKARLDRRPRKAAVVAVVSNRGGAPSGAGPISGKKLGN